MRSSSCALHRVVRHSAVGAGAVVLGVGAVAWLQAASLARRAAVAPSPDGPLDGQVGANPGVVVWLGDSLAAGVGAADVDSTLPRAVAARVGGAHVISLAVPGATSRDVVRFQLGRLRELHVRSNVDAVVVSVGANDVGAFTSRRSYRRSLAEIIEAAAPAPVVFVSIPQISDALRLPHPLRALAALRGLWLDLALRAVSDDDLVRYVSVRNRPVGARRGERLRYLSADRYHPSPAGYAWWADCVAPALAALAAFSSMPATTGPGQSSTMTFL